MTEFTRSPITTIGQVRDRLRAIRQSAGDDERAHSLQDALFRDVLAGLVLAGPPEVKALAKETLRVDKIEFSRWMA